VADVEVQTLLIVVLQVLVQETGLAQLERTEFEEVLAHWHVLHVARHLEFVLRTVVDEGVQEQQAVTEQFQEQLVAGRERFDLQQEMPITFDDVHDLLVKVDVVQNDLPLNVDRGLQTGQTVERRPSLLPEVLEQKLQSLPHPVDKIEQDRVVLEVGQLIVLIDPDLTGLRQQPNLTVNLDRLLEFVLLLLLGDNDELLQGLDDLGLRKELLGKQLDGGVVDVEGVVVVEEQE
jgi:hypothetical protein